MTVLLSTIATLSLLGILAASGAVRRPRSNCAFLGELSLDGQIRPINGVLPMAKGKKVYVAVFSGEEQPIHTILTVCFGNSFGWIFNAVADNAAKAARFEISKKIALQMNAEELCTVGVPLERVYQLELRAEAFGAVK